MKTILAPTDFSAASLNAVNYAADLAVAINGELMLVHVLQLPAVYAEVPVAVEALDDQVTGIEKKINLLTEQLITRTNGKIKISSDVSTGGSVAAEIRNYCEKEDPLFVVMGNQGTSAAERFLFGSNTIATMKSLLWPLIIVPPGAAFRTLKKIGFACDFRKVIETTPIGEINDLVTRFGAELHVIHVNTGDEKNYTPRVMEESGRVQQLFDGLNPHYHFLNDVNIEEGLGGYATKNDLDLLIIVPRKHGLVDWLFHKSHSKQLVIHTHIPVLAVHE